MRFQSFTPLLALVPHALASFKVAFDGGAFNVLDEIADTAAAPKYKVSSVHMPSLPTKEKKREDVPDYLFVLFCTLAGFRGDCDVFGSPPGSCGMNMSIYTWRIHRKYVRKKQKLIRTTT